MRFSVPICGYGDPRTPNAACFVDYARAVVSALRKLGHEVVPPTVDGNVDVDARPIVFGAQNMGSVDDPRDPGSFCPANAILYNSEQVGAAGAVPQRIFDAVETWKTRVVWDYSEANAAALRRLGVGRVVLCPVAYDDSMARVAPTGSEDIDVLFYGSVEPPHRIAGLAKAGIKVMDRQKILVDLQRAGLRVEHVFGVYGTDLDPYVARAKVVLNLHYYQGAVFEVFRCSQLWACDKCVVTEDGGVDDALEERAKLSCLYVARKDVVEACRAMVADAGARRAQGERGREEFMRTSLAENVRRALEQS